MTHAYLLDLVSSVTYHPETRAPVLPKKLASFISEIASKSVWWPVICPDEVERRFIDDVDTPGDWDAVQIVPDEIEKYALKYLKLYRSA